MKLLSILLFATFSFATTVGEFQEQCRNKEIMTSRTGSNMTVTFSDGSLLNTCTLTLPVSEQNITESHTRTSSSIYLTDQDMLDFNEACADDDGTIRVATSLTKNNGQLGLSLILSCM